MLLDNFTVIAQLLNFLILIWLLKRFLYGPLLAALDAREQRLRDQQHQAAKEQETALAAQQQFARQQQQLASRQAQLLLDARSAAEAERRRLIDQARHDIAELHKQGQERLAAEQQETTSRLRKHAEATMLQTLNAMLRELTSHDLQQAAVATFIQRLPQVTEQQRNQLCGNPAHRQAPYQVVTAAALSAAEKEQLEAAVTKIAPAAQFHYQSDSALLCGIELRHSGHKLSWSLASHLERLQQQLAGVDNRGERS